VAPAALVEAGDWDGITRLATEACCWQAEITALPVVLKPPRRGFDAMFLTKLNI
jgi:hypothetical protein